MSIKISELPQASTVNNTDVIPIVQGGITKKATKEMIATNDLKMISCKINSNYTGNLVGWTPTTIPLDTVIVNEGNCFTLSNNKIIVGAGVSLVRCEWAGARKYNSNDLMICVYKNDTLLSPSIYANEGEANTKKYMFGSCIAYTEVQEGDELKLCYRGGNTSGTILLVASYTLTVTAIKNTSSASTTTTLNTPLMNTGSLVGMGDRAEVTNEPLEKTKLEEVTDKDVREQEVKEVTPLETTEEKTEGSGDSK